MYIIHEDTFIMCMYVYKDRFYRLRILSSFYWLIAITIMIKRFKSNTWLDFRCEYIKIKTS